MPRVRNQSLGGRADQAGLLYAAGNTPATFQRTLMPRATMDQALVTGLSASANHALVTLVQDAIQSTALVLVGEARRRSVDERRWSRATIGRKTQKKAEANMARRAKKVEPRYRVNISMKAWDIAKAGAAVKLRVRDRTGLLGTIEIGQGTFGWRSARASKFKRISWAQLADKLEQP